MISIQINSPPAVDSVILSPNPLYSYDTLTVSTSVSDADGDPITEAYAWYEDGTLTSFTGTTIPASELDVGETWTVRVTPNDGNTDGSFLEEIITVSNTPPTISTATISSSDGSDTYNASILTCVAAASDSDEVVTIDYSWNIDGLSYSGSTLDLSTTSIQPNQSVECIASVTDSAGEQAESSATVSTTNRLPEVSSIIFSPDPVFWNQDLSVTGSFVDEDGDTVTGAYAWYENGTLTPFTGTTIPASELDVEKTMDSSDHTK